LVSTWLFEATIRLNRIKQRQAILERGTDFVNIV